MKTQSIQKQIKTSRIQPLALALLVGLGACPASQADEATLGVGVLGVGILGVGIRILPSLNATLIHTPRQTTHNNPLTLPLVSSLQDNQLCITHTKQILYSIETQASFRQRELTPSNFYSKPIGYDFIQTLQTRSTIESPGEINHHKADLSHVQNKTACTKISALMGDIDSLSDAVNSFADDRTSQVITVTINAE